MNPTRPTAYMGPFPIHNHRTLAQVERDAAADRKALSFGEIGGVNDLKEFMHNNGYMA